jgi:hypothetical protein
MIFVVLTAITGCVSQSLNDYNMAKQVNTTYGYEKFLKDHPDSEYSEEAKEKREALYWEEARRINTIDSYDGFVKRFPNGKYATKAYQNIQYMRIKEEEQKNDKKRNSLLTIKGISIGSNFKEQDKYLLYREKYFTGAVDEYLIKYNTGYSGFYPMEQQCVINGKKYKLDEEKNFFKGTILPGSIEIKTSFTEGIWDAYNREQKSGNKHDKRFYLKINPNDDIEVAIFFIYNGKQSDIQVKAIRKQEIVNQGSIETGYETIEIIQ